MADFDAVMGGHLDQDWEELVDLFIECDAGDGQPFKAAIFAYGDAEAMRSLSDDDLLFVGTMARTAIGEVFIRAAKKQREGE